MIVNHTPKKLVHIFKTLESARIEYLSWAFLNIKKQLTKDLAYSCGLLAT